jgi:hypothetical protein
VAATPEEIANCNAEWEIICKSHDLIQRATSDQLRFTGRDRPRLCENVVMS